MEGSQASSLQGSFQLLLRMPKCDINFDSSLRLLNNSIFNILKKEIDFPKELKMLEPV